MKKSVKWYYHPNVVNDYIPIWSLLKVSFKVEQSCVASTPLRQYCKRWIF